MKFLPINERKLHCAFCGVPHSKYIVKIFGHDVPCCNRCVLAEFEKMKEICSSENQKHVS